MPSVRFQVVPELTLEQLENYHDDIVASLRLYFSPASPAFTERYLGKTLSDAIAQARGDLETRLDESDLRSSLIALTALEAHFYTDFESRCRRRLKDDLSRYFRKVDKARHGRVRLDEDILEGWKVHGYISPNLISQLRGSFKFRHWLAHGRYWPPQYGRKYDFAGISLVASAVVSNFSFEL